MLNNHKLIFTNGAFFTTEGRMTDELPLRGKIYEELKHCAVNNVPRKISNIVELLKLTARVEDFPPAPDRICSWTDALRKASPKLFAIVFPWPIIRKLPGRRSG